MKYWQLQDAKARLSEVVKQALAKGPQTITLHGHPAVVVISNDEFIQLTKPKFSLVDFFQKSPLRGVNLELDRDQSPEREIDL